MYLFYIVLTVEPLSNQTLFFPETLSGLVGPFGQWSDVTIWNCFFSLKKKNTRNWPNVFDKTTDDSKDKTKRRKEIND